MRTVGFFAGAFCAFSNVFSSVVQAEPTFVCTGYKPSEPTVGIAAKPLVSERQILPSHGSINVLVVFAKFKDEAPGNDRVPAYAAEIFAPDRPGSFTHFYHTMSFGQLQVQGTVLPTRYASEKPASAYLARTPGEPGRYGQFALEIIQKVDAEHDLGLFDNDGPDSLPNSGDDDGVVDYVFINMLSMPPGFILGEATGIAGLWLEETEYHSTDATANGNHIRVSASPHGSIQKEGTFSQTVGIMAHELGHSLGLPDLYDLKYREPATDSAGIGKWGLMGWGTHGWNGDDGPNPFCAWSLEQLGWIGPDNEQLIEVRGDTTGFVLPDLHEQGFICKIPLQEAFYGSRNKLYLQEYLLLEYRARNAHHYNRNLPAEGLLIWHMDQQAQYAAKPMAINNAKEEKKLVDLVCADGLYRNTGDFQGRVPDPHTGSDDLDFWAHDDEYKNEHGGNKGDATDLFDGVHYTRFDLHSNPSTAMGGLPTGANTGLAIHMRRQGDIMVVDIRQPRWGGTIREDTFWLGDIVVDGDLTIAPEGRLIIQGNSRVRFTGTDRLQSGVDPTRCEMRVQGELRVSGPDGYLYRHKGGGQFEEVASEPVVFESLTPGETWYGIYLLSEIAGQKWGQVKMPEGSFVCRDAEYDHLPGIESAAGMEQPTIILEEAMGWLEEFQLQPNFPNPFNAQTAIRYALPEAARVRVVVYNTLGQEVRTLVDGFQGVGMQTVMWDGRNDSDREVASGIYLYQLQAGMQVETRKLLLLR